MENQISFTQGLIINLPAIVTGLTAIIAAAVTGFVTWLVANKQFEIKKYEIMGQSELKAREHLYNSYRQKLESRSKSFENFYNNLGKFYGEALATSDDEKEIMLKKSLQFFKRIFDIMDDPVMYYKNELKNQELVNDKYLEDLKQMENILKNLKVDKNNLQDVENDYFQLIQIVSIIGRIEADLLETKSEKLFNVFLN